jgi:hypothetical protein
MPVRIWLDGTPAKAITQQSKGEFMKLHDLLAHRSFRKLEQYKSHWQITYMTTQDKTEVEICDKDLDRLIDTYSTLVEAMDLTAEEHKCFYRRSWDDGTLLCHECGGWK